VSSQAKKRRTLAEAFGEEESRSSSSSSSSSETTTPVRGNAGVEQKKRKEVDVVPGKGGTPIRADTPVNMTFTVTAKERYLWTLELKRRGLSAISVLRRAMDELFEEERS
jgi:hypothetical protein